MALQYFTLIHILISLAGITTGFGVLSGLFTGKLFSQWTAFFLATTLATSVTGFFFPFRGITPALIVGVISLIGLAVAIYALYARQLHGVWRTAFVVSSLITLYFNFFVLVVQLFQKMPALIAIAPTQTEPPFIMTQVAVLIIFVFLGVTATKQFRDDSISA